MHGIKFWPKAFTKRAIAFTILLIAVFSIPFFDFIMPVGLMIMGILIIALFFNGIEFFQTKWINTPEKIFYRRIFKYSLIFRVLMLLYLLMLTWFVNPDAFPMDYDAADGWTYYYASRLVTDYIFSNPALALSQVFKGPSDWGFALYIGFFYSVFNTESILLIKILGCVWGSISVVLIARIAKELYSYKHAYIAGIIAMLMPALMWFDARYLKEALMIFLTLFIYYNFILIINHRKKIMLRGSIIISLIFFLLFFRVFLAVLIVLSFTSYIILNIKKAKRGVTTAITALLFVGMLFFISRNTEQFSTLKTQYRQLAGFGETNVNKDLQRIKNINVQYAAIAPLILIGSVVTPFPTVLNLDKRQFNIIAHYQNEIIRNLLYFFFFLGLFYVFRHDFRNSSLLLSFVIGYISILAITNSSFEDRFQLPALPFIIILMSVGFINSSPKWIIRWKYYIILIFFAESAWNLFKISIRGII